MQKKPNSSRKYMSRKSSISLNLEEFVISICGGVYLLNTNKYEVLATSTCPKFFVVVKPTYSGSLVPSIELPTYTSNEGNLKIKHIYKLLTHITH